MVVAVVVVGVIVVVIVVVVVVVVVVNSSIVVDSTSSSLWCQFLVASFPPSSRNTSLCVQPLYFTAFLRLEFCDSCLICVLTFI